MTDEGAARRESETRYRLPQSAAGFIRRGCATCADMIIFGLISMPFFAPVYRSTDWSQALAGFDELVSTIMAPAWSSHAAGVLGLWMALWWCYFLVGWGLLGATPGKWIFRLRVIDHHGRCPIGATRAVLRLVAYCISSTLLGLGHSLVLVRRDHRALHDILAGTMVVSTASRIESRTRDGA